MYISYCKKCNQFFYISRKSNYCRECKCPIIPVPISMDEFSKMTINERYRLAYKLSNNDNMIKNT
ncbi:MAG: hypothetical protein UHM23_02850 [Clostridia bacterium]|nr:hypothetical protein [Clostridia bacterium]